MTTPTAPLHRSESPDPRPDTLASANTHPLVDATFPFFAMPPPHFDGHVSWTSPDDMFANADSFDWSLPLSFDMSANGSDGSPSTDFAFEPPAMTSDNQTPTYSNGTGIPPSTGYPSSFASQGPYVFHGQGYTSFGTGSSFSSTSGSATGNSFSSVDALPAISRNFVRPSSMETKRPATAGGALQSRSPFLGYMPINGQGEQRGLDVGKTESPIVESVEGIFSNPFAVSTLGRVADDKQSQQDQSSVDPHFVSFGRASMSHNNGSDNQSGMWSALQPASNLTSSLVPPQINNPSLFGNNLNQHSQLQNLARSNTANLDGRPQTSDGLPNYANFGTQVPLPSARSIARSVGSGTAQAGYHAAFLSQTQARSVDQHMLPFRDTRISSMGDLPRTQPNLPVNRAFSMSSTDGLKIALQGPMRASYISPPTVNETLEHVPLSAGLTFVPLGGPAPKKRPRRRYDEIERLYKCGWTDPADDVEVICEKSYGTLNHLNAHVAMQQHGEKRLPTEFKDMRKAWRKKKRDALAAPHRSDPSAPPDSGHSGWSQRGSIVSTSSDSGFDRRNSTTSMMSAGSELSHPGSQNYANNYGWSQDSRPTTSSSVASVDNRSYAPAVQAAAYNHTYVDPRATTARRPSAPQHVFLPQGGVPYGFRQSEGDYPTPTQQNPFPGRQGTFPFQTLTSTMTMPTGPTPQLGNQFAFQR